MLTYTNIQHVFRKTNGLSCNEYVLCDMIYFLSTSPQNTAGGWCYSKRETLAEDLGITKQGVLKMIEKLIEKGFIIKHDVTKFLRTTERWNMVYFENVPSVNKVYPIGKQSLPDVGKQSLPNNNTINNNIDNLENQPQKIKTFKDFNDEDFQNEIKKVMEDNPNKFPNAMIKKFYNYWSEKTATGRMKFQKQETWETSKRMSYWLNNNYNK